MKNITYNLLFFFGFCTILAQESSAQDSLKLIAPNEYYGTTSIRGTVVKIMVIDGDTIPVVDFPPIEVNTKREFKTPDDRRRYNQWRKHAIKVYPYAAEAIRIHRQIEKETAEMRRGKRKKYSRQLEKDLKPKYEAELKKLTKTQGYILIKMVERELNQPFYDVIAQLRGDWEAFKWQSLGVWYGYNLQQGYKPEKDPLLESILQELNISYKENMEDKD